LAETIVALAIVGTVGASLSGFLIRTMALVHQNGDQQIAVQVAADAAGKVRSLNRATLSTGRDKASTDAQSVNATPQVASHLSGTQKTWDPTAAAGEGGHAPLPTSSVTTHLANIEFRTSWYQPICWRHEANAGGDCTALQQPGDVRYVRVVIAVTWPGAQCSGGSCTYITSQLISGENDDPVFS
jgi:hypothetical protein